MSKKGSRLFTPWSSKSPRRMEDSQVKVEAKKYNSLVNKQGAYQKLVGDWGTRTAKRILKQAKKESEKMARLSATEVEKEMTAGKKTGKTKRSRNNRKKSEDEMIWFLMVSHINSKQFTILQNDLRDEMEKGSKINWANILLWDGTAHLGGEGFGIDTIDKKIFTKILKIIDKWKKSGKINKTFAKKIKVGLTSRDRHAFDKRTALYDDRNTQFSSKKFIEKQEKELQSRFDKQDAVEQKASKKQGHKRLTNKEVNAKTNTYIRAKDKRGRYLKLVKKFGKTNADRIMTEVRKRGH